MFHTVLRSIMAHKFRLLSTTLAIILGVAFISGTYILTDTLAVSFENVFSSTTDGIDVAVRGTAEFTSQFGDTDRRPVPADVLQQVRELDDVRVASGEVTGIVALIDEEGAVVGGQGPPSLGVNGPVDSGLTSATLRSGAFPDFPDQIAVDAGTATARDIAVGDTIQLVVDGPVQDYTVSGIIGYGEVDSLAGATLVMFQPDYATELYGQDGFSEIYAAAADGVDSGELRDEVAALVGSDYEVLTGDELAASVTAEISDGLGFFTTALLVFAGVSLFVGSFLIANTFTIIVAQRTRELALLRAVGASRRQVVASVMWEALAVGLLGSLLGLALGAVLAIGLQAGLAAFGLDLPEGDPVYAPRTIVVSLVVGVGITLAAALMPAIRSTRVAPVAALQAVAAPPPRREGVIRYVLGTVVFLGGVGLLGGGLFGGGGINLVGAGAVVTLFGAAALSPLVTTLIVNLLGAPISATRGLPGQLAKENAVRSPRRTAATASALMIGLALVSFTFIMGASIKESAVAGIDQAFLAQFQINPAVQNGPPGTSPIPSGVVEAVDALDTVAVATPLTFGEFQYEDSVRFAGGVDPSQIDKALAIDFAEGSWSALGEGGVAITQELATDTGLAVGDTAALTFASTGLQQIPVRAVFDGANVDADWILDDQTFAANYADPAVAAVYVRLADGAEVDQARLGIDVALSPFPTVQLQDLDQVKQSIADQINQLLGLLNALLALSVLIALFGIVNTLGLSVLERTRELGLLRAVGAARSQIRTMIRWESILIAVLGATLGIMIGTLFGWMVVRALTDLGISRFVVPGGQLLVAVLIAGLAGVVAAILPARRASRIDILRALEAQ